MTLSRGDVALYMQEMLWVLQIPTVVVAVVVIVDGTLRVVTVVRAAVEFVEFVSLFVPFMEVVIETHGIQLLHT
jgi:hypothetical protein